MPAGQMQLKVHEDEDGNASHRSDHREPPVPVADGTEASGRRVKEGLGAMQMEKVSTQALQMADCA